VNASRARLQQSSYGNKGRDCKQRKASSHRVSNPSAIRAVSRQNLNDTLFGIRLWKCERLKLYAKPEAEQVTRVAPKVLPYWS